MGATKNHQRPRRRGLRRVAPGFSIMGWRRVNGTSPNDSAKRIRQDRVGEIGRLLRGTPDMTAQDVSGRYGVTPNTAAVYLREARALNAAKRGNHGNDV